MALLAQTCSQIGADSPTPKALLSSLDKKKSAPVSDSTARAASSPSSATNLTTRSSSRTSPPSEPSKLAFKPYETNVVSKREDRPSSKGEDGRRSANETRAPSRKSSSGSPGAKSTEEQEKDKTEGASPIIRSGMDILAGHPKDMPLGTYKPPGLGGLSALGCCPPGLDPTNPAFRPPYAGAPFSHHLLGGYGAGPYVSYARVKTAAGGEALVPVCKDPYCTGCQFSMHGTNSMLGQCPSGCTQCEHQKYGLAAAALGMLPPGLPYGPLGRPYVCSWMVGEAYCGKRFTSPDELLQHLRTHTTPSADAASLLYRYPNPPLSPLSAARFHPYAKPSGLPPSPFSAFNPTSLNPFYSPYALYGQRLGAAVHP